MKLKDRKKRRHPEMPTENEKETLETPIEEVETETAPAEETAVNPEVEAAKAEAEKYLALAQRTQADFENYRRRNEAARTEAYADGRRSVAAMFLDAMDNLERALASGTEADAAALHKGVELTLRQMQDTYKKLGVEAIDRAGETFDPNLENAVLQGTADDGEPGTVCQVLQKGYKMGDTVLRHAMVKVVPEE